MLSSHIVSTKIGWQKRVILWWILALLILILIRDNLRCAIELIFEVRIAVIELSRHLVLGLQNIRGYQMSLVNPILR